MTGIRTQPEPAVYEEDYIFQQLASSEDVWAKGAALYGVGGLLDASRKVTLSIRLLAIRDALPEKITEKVLDAMAHADAEYIKWVDSHVVARAEWLALDAQRNRLYAKIKTLNARSYDAKRNGV